MMRPALILDRPKYEVNVGGVLRSAEAFGVETVVIVGRRYARDRSWHAPTDVHHSAKRLDLRAADSLDEALRMLASHDPVFVERQEGAAALPAFAHPSSAVYVFGPEDGAVEVPAERRDSLRVVIPASDGVIHAGIGSLNLAVAASIVLYDRSAKEAIARARGNR